MVTYVACEYIRKYTIILYDNKWIYIGTNSIYWRLRSIVGDYINTTLSHLERRTTQVDVDVQH